MEIVQYEVLRGRRTGNVGITVNPDVPVFDGCTAQIVEDLHLVILFENAAVGVLKDLPDWALAKIREDKGVQFLVCGDDAGMIEQPFVKLVL